jgi:hypothetical protein
MAGLREALKGDDAGTITAKTNELAQAAIKLAKQFPRNRRTTPAIPAEPANNNKENIVDADFTEVDDETGKKKSA